MRNNIKKVKIMSLIIICLFMATDLTGCNMENIDTEKIRDLEYTILEEENIPEEVYEQVIADCDEFCRTAYVCSDALYIVVCYGAQPTEGYTIEINSLYESSNAICVETTLKGPSGQDKVAEVISYPYIVLQIENIDKTVVFN